ncbi:Hsp33 family molecular chaperone HslO [Bacteroidetes/Chlorobi group bacterium ChocPot_Mid]|nr:MAG: Hsp33 family molecular chaperone HslO [Bacteroidetes/Chlorobi group bacterium ChocPot_Mid]
MKKTKEEILEEFKTRDRVVKVLSKDGKFRAAMVKNTKSARTAQEKHKLHFIPAFLMARALAGASILSSFLKGEERVVIEVSGSGLMNYLLVEAMQVGEVRGYVRYDSELIDGQLNSLSDIFGEGIFKVIKILYNKKEPQVSVIPIQKGDIESEMVRYFQLSEQIQTAVMLEVEVDDNGMITQSGGIVIQAMPGAKKKDIERISKDLANVKSIGTYFNKGLTPDKAMKEILPFEFDLLSSTPVDFYCRCSKENFMSKLLTLESKEIQEMVDSGHNELVCQYCNTKYHLDTQDFQKLLEETKAKRN